MITLLACLRQDIESMRVHVCVWERAGGECWLKSDCFIVMCSKSYNGRSVFQVFLRKLQRRKEKPEHR